MKIHATKFLLLCAGLIWPASVQVSLANPPAKAVAPKAKLAPRPVPGMSGFDPNTEPAGEHPRAHVTAAKVRGATPSAPAVAGNGSNQTRILMIYRRGSVELPPVPKAPTVVPTTLVPNAAEVRPVTFIAPRPGTVRVITKAEAEALAAQPAAQP